MARVSSTHGENRNAYKNLVGNQKERTTKKTCK
jgi:hypothetical protein